MSGSGFGLNFGRAQAGTFSPAFPYTMGPRPDRTFQGSSIDFGRPQVGSFSPAPFVVREEGGYIGEEGGVTEGEFNHDTNKKAIIDEENGQKEGELTGGEMVLNPEQTDGITTLVEKGDAEGLLTFLRDLLSQPQFQEA